MKEFWNSILTEKSYNLLIELTKKPFNFIVIGGWAFYLWTKLHKSKDIDIVIDLKGLEYLKKNYNLNKNDSLKKYEIKIDEIDIDTYVPYYSKLNVPIEDLKDYTTKIENITTIIPEILLILKQGAELDRKETVKGNKDQIDILTLIIYSDIDFKKYKQLLKKYNLEHYLKRLKEIIKNFKDIDYLDINLREFKLKKEKLLNII